MRRAIEVLLAMGVATIVAYKQRIRLRCLWLQSDISADKTFLREYREGQIPALMLACEAAEERIKKNRKKLKKLQRHQKKAKRR